MICIEITGTGERRCLEYGFYIRRLSNGMVVRCHRVHAQGVSDGEQIWSLGSLEGYPGARIVTRAEFEESLVESDADPELSDGEALHYIMEGTYYEEE